MPERGGASAGRWLACGVVYLPASRPRRPLLVFFPPPFFPSIRFASSVGLDGGGPVVCWSCFAGAGWPLHLCSACFGRTRPKASSVVIVTLARRLPYGYGGRRLGWLHDGPTRWTVLSMDTIFLTILLVTIDGKVL